LAGGAGPAPGRIRLSVGLENLPDLNDDISQALDAIAVPAPAAQ
jgi:cystathionine beta-lyase/cystathionine gamma-synthase